MRRIGIDPEASGLSYVVVSCGIGGEETVESGRIAIKDGRDSNETREFYAKLQELFARTRPSVIRVKAKPENGQMRAGSKTFKMEAMVITASTSQVEFVPSAKLKAVHENTDLFAYLQDAWRCAVITDDQIKAKGKRKPA